MRLLATIIISIPIGMTALGYFGNLFFGFLVGLGLPHHAAAAMTFITGLSWVFLGVILVTLRIVDGRWLWEEHQ